MARKLAHIRSMAAGEVTVTQNPWRELTTISWIPMTFDELQRRRDEQKRRADANRAVPLEPREIAASALVDILEGVRQRPPARPQPVTESSPQPQRSTEPVVERREGEFGRKIDI